MWPGSKIPAPWANTTDPSKLVQVRRVGIFNLEKKAFLYIIIKCYLCVIIVPGNDIEGKRQKRLIPCVSGHSHAQS